MKGSEFNKCLGGWKIGQKLEMISGPEKGTILEITKVGIHDDQGFPAVEITYSSGEVEVSAIQILDDCINGRFEHQVKFI